MNKVSLDGMFLSVSVNFFFLVCASLTFRIYKDFFEMCLLPAMLFFCLFQDASIYLIPLVSLHRLKLSDTIFCKNYLLVIVKLTHLVDLFEQFYR